MPKLAEGTAAKSAFVAVRLTPRMRFGLTLMTRIHERSISESLTLAIESLFTTPEIGLFVEVRGNDAHPRDLLKLTWSEDAWQRFVRLAAYYPEALTRKQAAAWQAICDSRKYWKDRSPRTKLIATLHPRQLLADLDDKQLEADWARIQEQMEPL